MNANPRLRFLGSSLLVATRTLAGGFFSKCFVTDSVFAEKGRLPVDRGLDQSQIPVWGLVI